MAQAHDAGISTVQGHVRADAIELVAGFAPADAQQFVIIADAQGMTVAKRLLSAKDDSLEVPFSAEATKGAAANAPAEAPPTFWGFVRLGVGHIWTGYDHLLF
ncbi:MAG: hypothetical protein HY736_13000, partial [Verrucomicrobia bacterium]|nr:hypothetical protein [Verrucomicrobiota bacterium]